MLKWKGFFSFAFDAASNFIFSFCCIFELPVGRRSLANDNISILVGYANKNENEKKKDEDDEEKEEEESGRISLFTWGLKRFTCE